MMTDIGNTFEPNNAPNPGSEETNIGTEPNTQPASESPSVDGVADATHGAQAAAQPASTDTGDASAEAHPEPPAAHAEPVDAGGESSGEAAEPHAHAEAAPEADAAPAESPAVEAPTVEAPAPAEPPPAVEAAAAAAPVATPGEVPGAPSAAPIESAAATPAATATAEADSTAAAAAVAGEESAAAATAGAGEEGAAAHEEGEGGGRRSRGRQLPKMAEEEMREIWKELTAKKNSGEEIEIEVISTNRGGVVGHYKGVEVFIPVSHWSLDRHNSDAISGVSHGDKLAAHVLEITTFDTDARRVTATRRTLLRRELMTSLEVGQRMKGRVASILDFGAFVDLGGVDGLVHASEISFDRTKKPAELLNKGDEVDVVIREIDREKKRIYLSMKDLLDSPWEGVEERYPVGSLQNGKVVGIGKNGAFIELSPGLEGFVRVSELSWTKRVNNPKEILRKGQDIEVKVLDASARKQRLSLSYRQAQPDPWATLAETHGVGTTWEGEVREISNKGVVVSVGDVEGFLPRGRMGREARKLTEMKVADKLNVIVIEVNPASHSLIFSLPIPENEGGGGGGGGERERSGGGGGGGGERRGRGEGGGGRRDDRRGDRHDRDRFATPVSPVNEMKSADTVTNFALGDIIGEAIKRQLNYSAPAKPAAEAPASPATPNAEAAPAAATAATPVEAAPAAEAAAAPPAETASVETAPAASHEEPAAAAEPAEDTAPVAAESSSDSPAPAEGES